MPGDYKLNFCVLYCFKTKTILIKIFISSKFCFCFAFWPEPVNRPVGRPCVRSSRSTDPVDRPSRPRFWQQCVSVCTFHGRPGGRPKPAWL